MIQKIKNVIIAVAALGAVAMPALVPAVVNAADIQGSLCEGTNLTVSGSTSCGTSASTTKVNALLTKIVNVFSIIVGIIAVVMIIIGGLRYITSGGESSNISTAKNTIIYALVGLVIVALAQFIVHYVLGNAAGITS